MLHSALTGHLRRVGRSGQSGDRARGLETPRRSTPMTESGTGQPEVTALYGGPATRRVRTRDLILAKQRGTKWAMLTSYDQYTAGIFDAAGIPVLLVGDSAANNVFGYETTVPVTVDD